MKTAYVGPRRFRSDTGNFMAALDRQRWLALADRVGLTDADDRFVALCGAYGQPLRHYHTSEHIVECLDVLDRAEPRADAPDELEYAIWLHDIVYDPRCRDNEARSAAMAVDWLATAGSRIRENVRGLILATRHESAPTTPDEAVIQDIDLHILGAEPARFDRYEAAIRLEYAWVPAPIFRRARREVLAEFIRREHLYNTPWFRTRFEERARSNLERSLARL